MTTKEEEKKKKKMKKMKMMMMTLRIVGIQCKCIHSSQSS